MAKGERRSFFRWIRNMAISYKHGLQKPHSMLAARIDVAVWFFLLLSSLMGAAAHVANQEWAPLWSNAILGLIQGMMLRWSIHGYVYRKEIRAREAEERKFIEIVKNGYEIKYKGRSN